MITRTDVLAHLEYGMRTGFLSGTKQYSPLRSGFVRETGSTGAFETYADMGALPWPRQNGGQTGSGGTDGRTGAEIAGGLHEGGPIVVLGGNERSLEVYNQDWDIPIGIYHNAINDNRVGGLEDWARSAGSRFEQHKDYLCFNALNTGDSATSAYGKCYDGQTFFSASHADKGAEYATAQSNTNSLALSLDNFETVFINASGYKDDRGEPTGLVPDLLIHPVNLFRTAANICGNSEDYATGNRAVNPWAGKIKPVQAPGGWLDTTAWYLAVSGMVEKPLILQARESPSLIFWDDYTQGNGIRYYKWTARYAVAYADWRLCTMGRS